MLMVHGQGHLLPKLGICGTQLLQEQSQAGLVLHNPNPIC